MPVTVSKRGDKYRVIEAATGKIATSSKGNPVDGGGHATEAGAKNQARAINASLRRKHGKP